MARNRTTSGLMFDRRDVRRHQHHHSSGGAAVRGTGQDLTNDLAYHRDNTRRPSSRYGGECSPPNFSQSLHCLDRPPTTEKPSGGGGNCDNSEHLFSQVQYVIVTNWMTMRRSDEFNKQRSWAKGWLSDYETLRNRARSLPKELRANTSCWKEMLQASLSVLSSTSWSEAAGEDPDRGRARSRTQILHDQGFSAWRNIIGSNKGQSDNITEIIWGRYVE